VLKLPLNIPILSLEIYTANQANADLINSSKNDIAGTLKVVGDFKVVPQAGLGQEVPQFPGVIPVAVFGAVTKK
jgi:hypothetical protein